jgi:hypothetical protein
MKKHGCLLTYLLYIVIYFLYFILLGKLFSIFPLSIKSDDLLAILLFVSFVLAALTATAIANKKKILNFFKSKKAKST